MMSIVGIMDSVTRIMKNWDGERRRTRTRNEFLDDRGCNFGNSKREPKRRKIVSSSKVTVCQTKTITGYANEILGWLRDDETTTIGIYGMGGVGKTTLAKQLETQVMSNGIYRSVAVAWVSVDMHVTLYQLQHDIALAFRFDQLDDKDVNRRAATLYDLLSHIPKCVLFLDNLWGDFRREDVGIPKHCKLVLVSRSLDVCRIMHCQKRIKVKPLPDEEAWQLFCNTIGSGVLDSKQITGIAKLLCHKCGGIPLAITLLANRMRGVVDASMWSKVLESLDRFPKGPVLLEDLFTVLRRSYDSLSSVMLQPCFLYCALYPKGYAISREQLIDLWIGEMLIDDVLPLQAQYDMGHCILNKLLNSCLLETSEDKSKVKMHDLVRDMALYISGDRFMAKAGLLSTEKSSYNGTLDRRF